MFIFKLGMWGGKYVKYCKEYNFINFIMLYVYIKINFSISGMLRWYV